MKKLFLYIFCPNWIIYKSINVKVTAYSRFQYWEIPNSRHEKVITINIMFSSVRNKYKIIVLNVLESEKHALNNIVEYVQAKQKVYELNHSM